MFVPVSEFCRLPSIGAGLFVCAEAVALSRAMAVKISIVVFQPGFWFMFSLCPFACKYTLSRYLIYVRLTFVQPGS